MNKSINQLKITFCLKLLSDSQEETFIAKFLQDHLAKITQRPKQKLIHKVPQLSSIMYPSSELSLLYPLPPYIRAATVTIISSCGVCRQGIEQLKIPLVLFFLLFLLKVAGSHGLQ